MPRTGLTAEEIRKKAIDATIEKMREVGFEKVRLTDIAKEIGLSHAALYSHFTDKSALLDAVSESWLLKIDKAQEALCLKSKDPCEKIQEWALGLHRAKVEKIRHDPELYKAFDMASESQKPFVKRHMETTHRQLLGLVKEAIAKKHLCSADPETMTRIIREAGVGFHHPKLVAQYINEKRETLLRQIIDSVLEGLHLKP